MDLDLEIEDFNDTVLFDNITETQDSGTAGQTSFIIYLIFSIVGLIENALVLFVILWYRQMRTTFNIYVFNVALGDTLNMICLGFFAMEIAHTRWLFGTNFCKVFWVVSNAVTFTSIYFLTAMSISNCIQVYFPVYSSKRHGPKAAIGISICIWLLCLLLGIPHFMYSGLDDSEDCRIIWPEPFAIWSFTFAVFQFVVALATPLLINSICFILTALSLKNDSYQGVGKDSIVLLVLLTLVFVIFWLPLLVLEIMSSVSDLIVSPITYYIIGLLPYLKCCIYPIIYVLRCPSFKEIFKNIFCCR
ncbi:hypothetical protein GDO86_017515 [Hymenochirus boettgeri]|uniref:G-protein coupled receptors family 1 profile domain-containing protein n=1 Tax=Hymenochirus boettgeri TaxID=247094 RepID=A0A8T2IQR0_9PIPI|nr:hypothetical protein GDO86_017515 [Hymenochirus boettgeri]